MKKRTPGLISLVGLWLLFLVIRYPLFRLHGMKDWPLVLFVFGAIVIVIFGILLRSKILSACAVMGYGLGFFLGYLFRFDYGKGQNSLWIIWTCSYLAVLLAGAGLAIVKRKSEKSYGENRNEPFD